MKFKYSIFILLIFVSLLSAKTIKYTSYYTKTNYTVTKTHSPSPGTIIQYKSTTNKTSTSSVIRSSTSKPKAASTLTTRTYVYVNTTSTKTKTLVTYETSSIFSTYTIK